MMRLMQTAALVLLAVLVLGLAATADTPAKHTIKSVADSAPPKELKEPVRKLLDNKAVEFANAKGEVVAEVWFNKEVAVKATEAQVKNGLTYKEVPLSTILGAIRINKAFKDYRKQRVAPGVYTLRIAQQPQDGDHMGTAPYGDFVCLSPAADDGKADLMDGKALHELSGKTTEGHPSVLVLFPGKGAEASPKFVERDGGHGVVLIRLNAKAGEVKATLLLGLTLVGESPAA